MVLMNNLLRMKHSYLNFNHNTNPSSELTIPITSNIALNYQVCSLLVFHLTKHLFAHNSFLSKMINEYLFKIIILEM